MKDFLDSHHAVIEIVFALSIFTALIYSIHQKDAVAVGTLTGGIFGYLKGRSDEKATAHNSDTVTS